MTSIDKLFFITNLLFNLCDKIEDENFDLTEEQADNIVNYSKDIRQDLQRLKKLEKAIEIIKEKQINIVMFCMFHRSLSDYNDWLDRTNHQNKFKLNQEEFDLLNKVFKNE